MKKAIRFSIVVWLFSWAVMGAAYWGLGISPKETPEKFGVLATICVFFPMLTALVLQAIDKEKLNKAGLVNFKVSWLWLVAWLLPVVMTFACIPVNGLLPGVELQDNTALLISQQGISEEQQNLASSQFSALPTWALLLSTIFGALLSGITINALIAFGENYGWRCYLVDTLREVKFWKAALFIGVVWGLWYFPLVLMGFNYPNEPYWGVLRMVVVCILLGIIELYFVLKAKSMIVAAIFQGTSMAIGSLVFLFIHGGNDFLNGMTGLAGIIVYAATILCIWIYDKYISKDNICSMTLGEALER